jgi:hypothetical protein
VTFATFRLSADLRVLARIAPPPELLFVAFDRLGRGFFVEDRSGRLELRVTRAGAELLRLDLGPRVAADFAQDIHFAADGTAAIAFWSGRVELVRQTGAGFERARVDFSRPAECAGPEQGAVFYSAFVESLSVYATLYCDAAIARAPLPAHFLAAP